MNVIIDTNILISGMIKSGLTRQIIITSRWNIFYPQIAMQELDKYEKLIIKKSALSEIEYEETKKIMLNHINLFPTEMLINKMHIANRIMEKIDPKDVVFLATAMSLDNSIIWSNDKHLKKQKEITTYNTQEIIKLHQTGLV